jgi:hypothetical protein
MPKNASKNPPLEDHFTNTHRIFVSPECENGKRLPRGQHPRSAPDIAVLLILTESRPAM